MRKKTAPKPRRRSVLPGQHLGLIAREKTVPPSGTPECALDNRSNRTDLRFSCGR
jgi:hypothetical protein